MEVQRGKKGKKKKTKLREDKNHMGHNQRSNISVIMLHFGVTKKEKRETEELNQNSKKKDKQKISQTLKHICTLLNDCQVKEAIIMEINKYSELKDYENIFRNCEMQLLSRNLKV